MTSGVSQIKVTRTSSTCRLQGFTLKRFIFTFHLVPFLRFTKNLSPDKINLSTLKGEGQLSNLELDEEVLQNMLDLPTWLAVTRVYCNKAAIRVCY